MSTRQSFQHWANGRGYDTSLIDAPICVYESALTDAMWEAWQAATDRLEAECSLQYALGFEGGVRRSTSADIRAAAKTVLNRKTTSGDTQ